MKGWLKKKKYKYQLEEVFKKAKLYDEHITRGGKITFILRFMMFSKRMKVYGTPLHCQTALIQLKFIRNGFVFSKY